MFRIFKGQTADSVWQQIATAFRSNEGQAQKSRAGETREILHAAISIADPRQRWVISRSPPMNPAFALAEVIWIMRGRNDSAFLNYFNSQLPKYAGYGKTYHGAYGFRWRRQFQFDQLERAYKALKANPSTRQVVLQIWDPRIDLPNVKGKPAAPDVPCNIVSLLKIRNNCLEWTQIMRSNDVFRGFPHNVVQFTAVQEVLAGWLGLQVGSYNHFSDSLHVYQDKESDDLPAIRQSLPCSIPLNNDDLSLPKATSDKMFLELERCVDRIIKTKTTCSDIQLLVKTAKLSEAYKNILIVLCSEALRRRKKSDFAKEMITQCSNKALRHMFERWMAHLQRRAQEMA